MRKSWKSCNNIPLKIKAKQKYNYSEIFTQDPRQCWSCNLLVHRPPHPRQSPIRINELQRVLTDDAAATDETVSVSLSQLWVVKQGDTCEEALQRHLVEDKSPNGGASYADFLYHLHVNSVRLLQWHTDMFGPLWVRYRLQKTTAADLPQKKLDQWDHKYYFTVK